MLTRSFDLAQVNIALLREPLDSPLLADFVAALTPVNSLADSSRGFVWRLQTGDGDATAVRVFDNHFREPFPPPGSDESLRARDDDYCLA